MSVTTAELPSGERAARAVGVPLWAVAAALTICLVGLLLAYPLGVGGDYPNHLARTFIEAGLPGSSVLAQHYEVDWIRPIPDLVMDLTVPWLSRVFGIYHAGALVTGLSLASVPLGAVALSRSLHSRAQPASLLAFAAAFSMPAGAGFVNFVAATGLALLAFALWVRMRPGWRRVLIFAGAGFGLAAAHALGLFLLGCMAAAFELGRIVRTAPTHRLGATAAAARDGLAFLPGLAFVGAAMLGSADLNGSPFHWGFEERIMAALSPVFFELSVRGACVGALALITAFGALYAGVRQGALRVDPRMVPVCVVLAVMALLAPVSALGIWGLHFRFGAVFFAVVAASISAAPGGALFARWAGRTCAAAVLPVVAVSAAAIVRTDAAFDEARMTLRSLPAGARILPVQDDPIDFVVGAHLSSLAVTEREAYVPNLFTHTSPVGVRAAYRPRHLPGGAVYRAAFLDAERLPAPTEARYHSDAFYHGWPAFFTHVVYARSDAGHRLKTDRLEEVAASRRVVVYRVRADR